MAQVSSAEREKRSILITGCSSGIGYCVAHGLKKRGYRVFATARKLEDVNRLRAEGLISMQLDVADSDSIHTAVQQVLSRSEGQLYGLFNNAGYGQPGALEDLSREALQEQFETNVFGVHELTRQVIPVMRRQGAGRIIQNSSVLGFIALPYRGAYNATKYALEGLSDTLRLELKGTGIYVSLIEPGPITSRFRDNSYEMYKKHIVAEQSVHRALYEEVEARLLKEGDAAVPFTLPPEAVLKRVIWALEARRPQTRYYVTLPTYLFGGLKRLLPDKLLDWWLSKVPN